MGFGTLFIGYFLLLNVTYYTFTDVIAALVMAMGLYKLSTVNKHFKNGFYSSLMLALIGVVELIFQAYGMFNPNKDLTVLYYTDIPRYLIISVLTTFILMGIENVASEVELSELSKRAKITKHFSFATFAILALLSIHELGDIIDVKILSVASVLMLLFAFIMIIINLVTIYSSYMRICMPEDKDNEIPDKPSKFEFVNKYREHTAQKQREYAEYKLNKLKEKNQKKKKK